jgi:hypothetical protein
MGRAGQTGGYVMADIFAPYIIFNGSVFCELVPGSSFIYVTTDNFARGVNVYASAISNLYSRDSTRPLIGHAFILKWSVYGADGQIVPVSSPLNPFLSSVYINDCANITFGVGAGGGYCNTQFTVFRR